MTRLLTPAPIVAILYHEGRHVDHAMRRIATRLSGQGLSLVGFIQRHAWRPDRPRCDVILDDLSGGHPILISEDRGVGARGCRLNVGELIKAIASARAAIAGSPDLLVVNKFGKIESTGGGFRDLVAAAIEQEVPVLVAVPWRNMDSWRQFAGDFAIEHNLEELPADGVGLCRCLGLHRRRAPSDAANPCLNL